jgi:NAD+ kinase
MRIGLVAHPKKRLALRGVKEFIGAAECLAEEGADIELMADGGLSRPLGRQDIDYRRVQEMDADAIVCIGGDGTLLRTMQLTSVPVLGLNAGSLGFLMEPYPSNMTGLIRDLIGGRTVIEERSKLGTVLNDDHLPDAVNEAVVMTSTPSKIQDLAVSIDGEKGLSMRADGVIISTPTGSTSYALSAGGSIIDPRIAAFEIVPLAPFRVNIRPLLVPDSSTISMHVLHRSRAAVIIIDGNFRKRITHKDRIEFRRSKDRARFIRFGGGFYERVNQKILNYVNPQMERLK